MTPLAKHAGSRTACLLKAFRPPALTLMLTALLVTGHCMPTLPSWAAPESPPPAEAIAVQLKWHHQFQFAGYYAAVEKGYYRDAGLDVTLREGRPEINPSDEVLAGRAQYGIANPSILIERTNGRPLVVLAAIFQHSPLAIISLKSSGIASPHDLIGRRVMMRPQLQPDLMIMLKNEGVDPARIAIAAPSYTDAEDLISGRVDAIAGYTTDRPFELERRQIPYVTIHPLTYGIDFYGDCLFTAEGEIEEHPQRVRAFLAATMRGWEYALSHKEEIAGLILKKYGSRMDRKKLLFEAHAMDQLIMPELIELGHMNPGRWRHIGDVFVRAGMLDANFTTEGLLYDPKTQRYDRLLQRIITGAAVAGGIILLVVAIMAAFNRQLKRRVEESCAMLRESQDRFSLAMEATNDGLWDWDITTDAGYFSPGYYRMLGYEPGEFPMTGRAWLDHIHPDDRAKALKTNTDCIENRVGSFEVEFRMRTKSGGWRWVLGRGSAVARDHTGKALRMIGTHVDITERRLTEERLQRLATAVEQAAEGIAVLNREGSFIYVNPAYEKITGYSSDELIGRTPALFYNKELDGARLQQQSAKIFRGETTKDVMKISTKSGRSIDVEITVSPIRQTDVHDMNYASVIRDITLELQLEQQLQQTQKMEAIGTLAGGIAHDFNNILAAIIGYTELSLDQGPPGSSLRHNLEQILNSSLRARDLVRQILAFSRKEIERREPVCVSTIVKEALKLLRASIPATIEIRDDIAAQDGMVSSTPTQVHQILMNLCTNAAHAMADTGGVLNVTLRDVTVEGRIAGGLFDIPPGPCLELTVSDTGTGIDPAIIDRIFDPFFTTKEVGKGTGMGLAMVHGLVKSLGGDIRVTSTPGKGSTFRVLLPKTEASSSPGPKMQSLLPRGSEKILFVDDEKMLVETARAQLESLGYAVTATQSSLMALELFRNHPDGFDLIITDQTMPHLTGKSLAEKCLAVRPGIPIILCTGYSEKMSEQNARELGIRAFVLKPINRQQIAEIIRSVLDSAPRQD